jgi:perosamine synthetase
MNKMLAFSGGDKLISKIFTPYNSIGSDEIAAAKKVLDSGVLSKFVGAWHPDFYGGPKVQEFERECEKYFNVKHAVSINSWTSGLIAAIGAIGIEPGDEIIVSPWTMSASATAILHWNAIPVFADIEDETFNIDINSIEKNISPYTKAILAVDIFGHSADIDSLRSIADKYNLKIISDTAQSPGAFYKGKLAGTLSDIGGYSLNYHKHIHTGEGGILVTNDSDLADRMQLIRNHAEAVVGNKGTKNLNNMIGYNFRLGEIESAIGIEQLKKLSKFVSKRQMLAKQLTEGLSCLDGLRPPVVKLGCTHSYYVYPILIDSNLLSLSAEKISLALKAEGVLVTSSYQNLHLLPMYQNKIAYGSHGFPWTSDICKRDIDYSIGICPVAEKLNISSYLGLPMCVFDYTEDDVSLIIQAFHKVWSNMNELLY